MCGSPPKNGFGKQNLWIQWKFDALSGPDAPSAANRISAAVNDYRIVLTVHWLWGGHLYHPEFWIFMKTTHQPVPQGQIDSIQMTSNQFGERYHLNVFKPFFAIAPPRAAAIRHRAESQRRGHIGRLLSRTGCPHHRCHLAQNGAHSTAASAWAHRP